MIPGWNRAFVGMATSQFPYFFIREVALTLHQQAAQHHPALLPSPGAALGQDFVQRSAAVGVASSFARYAHSIARHIVLYLVKQQRAADMTPQHAAFAALVELLRRRPVPGWQRREEERQANFEARYCETSTECPSTANEQSDSEWP